MQRCILWIAFLMATIGCGGSVEAASTATSTGATTGGGGASTSTSTTNATIGSGGGMYLDCPQTFPNGGSCAVNGLRCSYGDEVAPACRSVAVCTMGSWVANPGNDTCNPPICPGEIPAATTACNSPGAQCGYPDGTICDCNPCEGGGACMPMASLHWFCDPPPSTPGCPPIAPNEGAICSTPVTCSYPPACISPDVVCMDGAWKWESITCGG